MSHKQKSSYFPWSCYICNGFCMARIATFRGCCLGWLWTSDVYTAKSLSWTRNRSPRELTGWKKHWLGLCIICSKLQCDSHCIESAHGWTTNSRWCCVLCIPMTAKRRFSYRFPWIVDQHQPSTILIFHQSSNDVHWLVICKRFS